jgi:hypothetical protein
VSTSVPQRLRVYLWTLVSLHPWASLPILLKNSTASPYTTTATTTTIKNQAKSTLHLRAQIRIDRVDADNVSLVASTKSGRLHICITWGAFCCTTPGSTLSAWCYRHRVSSSWQRRLRSYFFYFLFFLFRFSASHRPYQRKGHGDPYLDYMAFDTILWHSLCKGTCMEMACTV